MKKVTTFSKIAWCVLIGLWGFLEALLVNTSEIPATRWKIIFLSLNQLIIVSCRVEPIAHFLLE